MKTYIAIIARTTEGVGKMIAARKAINGTLTGGSPQKNVVKSGGIVVLVGLRIGIAINATGIKMCLKIGRGTSGSITPKRTCTVVGRALSRERFFGRIVDRLAAATVGLPRILLVFP